MARPGEAVVGAEVVVLDRAATELGDHQRQHLVAEAVALDVGLEGGDRLADVAPERLVVGGGVGRTDLLVGVRVEAGEADVEARTPRRAAIPAPPRSRAGPCRGACRDR
ncbi:MAG: hypothetical protein U0802_04100 [Candidatus Binatia bacterium]